MESVQWNKQEEALCVTLKLFDSYLSHLFNPAVWLQHMDSVCKTLLKCRIGTLLQSACTFLRASQSIRCHSIFLNSILIRSCCKLLPGVSLLSSAAKSVMAREITGCCWLLPAFRQRHIIFSLQGALATGSEDLILGSVQPLKVLCHLGLGTSSLWVSFSSSIKWKFKLED